MPRESLVGNVGALGIGFYSTWDGFPVKGINHRVDDSFAEKSDHLERKRPARKYWPLSVDRPDVIKKS